MRHFLHGDHILHHRHHVPRKDVDMTSGPLFRKIFLFSLPIVLTNLLQTFFNAADMMVVSLSSEVNAVGAIGATNAFISTILTLFIGISGGVTVVVAQRLGAGDTKATGRAVHTAVAMALPIGLLAMTATILVCRPILMLLGTKDDLLRLAVRYTRIYAFGLPLTTLFNFAFGIFNAKGDSRTPLVVMTSAGALNVLLNLFFVLACKMSVEGVAIATAVSNGISAVVLLWRLKVIDGPCRFFFRKLAFHMKEFRQILYNGIPNALQGSMFGISNMMITSSVMQINNAVMATLPPGTTYQPVISGNGVASSLQGFASVTATSISQAAMPFAGQNAGARDFRRVRRVLFESYIISAVFVSTIALLTLLFCDPLLALYGITGQGEAQRAAYETALLKMRLVGSLYFLDGLMSVSAAVLRGLGKAVTSATIVLFGACVFRFIWIFTIFRRFGTLTSLYLSYPISWTITTIVLFTLTMLTIRKKSSESAVPAAT